MPIEVELDVTRVAALFVHNDAGVQELEVLADALVDTGRWDPVFVLVGSRDFVERSTSRLARWRVHAANRPDVEMPTGRLRTPRLLARQWRSYRASKSVARGVLAATGAEVLVFPSVGPGRGIPVAAALLGGAAGIPSLCLPVASFQAIAIPRFLRATGAYDAARVDASLLHRVVARLRPDLVGAVDGEPILFEWPPVEALAASMARVEMRHPYWRDISDLRWPIAVRSPADVDELLVARPPAGMIHITGRPTDDLVARSLVAPTHGTRILCALPQLAEHGFCNQAEADRRLRLLLEQLTAVPDAEVLVSLHPRIQGPAYTSLLAALDIAVLDRPLATSLGGAAVLVAMGSSTIELALAAGIDVVDLTCWFDHGMFERSSRARARVDDERTIGEVVARVLAHRSDPAHRAAALEDAPYWGTFDGQACVRIERLLTELVGGGPAPPRRG